MIELDGAHGEGGGQILRSALALSILTSQPFRLYNLRANRSKPGLRPQHLAAVQAAAQISSAQTSGAALNSREITFAPQIVRGGAYTFRIPTAGAASLLLHTLYLPLLLSGKSAHLTLGGGTHVPHSPSFDYLTHIWQPAMQQIGLEIRLQFKQAGFYPEGGGEFEAILRPANHPVPLNAQTRGDLVRIRGYSQGANLPEDILRQQKLHALSRLQPVCRDSKITLQPLPAPGKGTALFLLAESQHARAGFSALGKKGKPAEQVADEAVNELLAYLNTPAALDPHLADQILLPLAFADGESAFCVSSITQHLRTNADTIRAFLPVKIEIQGELGAPGMVHILP
ncbi:MAG: RNA 3'-terminal phosphate cyclase [Anaerolineales bacterium]